MNRKFRFIIILTIIIGAVIPIKKLYIKKRDIRQKEKMCEVPTRGKEDAKKEVYNLAKESYKRWLESKGTDY